MKCPPLIMKLKIINQRHNISLWLPLFLILPLALVAVILLLPLVILAAIILWPFGYGKQLLLAGPRITDCICELRNLEVNIQNKRESVLIYFK